MAGVLRQPVADHRRVQKLSMLPNSCPISVRRGCKAYFVVHHQIIDDHFAQPTRANGCSQSKTCRHSELRETLHERPFRVMHVSSSASCAAPSGRSVEPLSPLKELRSAPCGPHICHHL